MERIIAFFMIFLIVFGCASTVFADEIDNISINEFTIQESHDFYDRIKDVKFVGDGSIYVTMHHEVSDVGKVYTVDDFWELDVEYIEDLTGANSNDTKEDYGDNFRNVLKITLIDKSEQNIISAIQKLQERSDEDIYWAEPVYFCDGIDTFSDNSINGSNLGTDFADYWTDNIYLPQAKAFMKNK